MLCLEIMDKYKDWSKKKLYVCALCVWKDLSVYLLKYDIQVGIAY